MVAIMGASTSTWTLNLLEDVRECAESSMAALCPGNSIGDIFAWYVKNQVPASYYDRARAAGTVTHEYLQPNVAARQPVGGHGLVALKWLSGNRSVLVDHELGARRGSALGRFPRRSTARCWNPPHSARAGWRRSPRAASRSPNSSLPAGCSRTSS